jgi:hypothetical protein
MANIPDDVEGFGVTSAVNTGHDKGTAYWPG